MKVDKHTQGRGKTRVERWKKEQATEQVEPSGTMHPSGRQAGSKLQVRRQTGRQASRISDIHRESISKRTQSVKQEVIRKEVFRGKAFPDDRQQMINETSGM